MKALWYYWGPFLIILPLLFGIFGYIIGGTQQASEFPSKYANGYCHALGGERLNDETCNVDGKVVVIP